MRIDKFIFNPFQINCYIYRDENTREGILIDPAVYNNQEEHLIKDFIKDNDIKIKYIINTHGHIDHILGNAFARENYNAPLLLHKDDDVLVKNSKYQAEMFGIDFKLSPAFDGFIDENLKLYLGNNEITFLHSPGHSPGSVCIVDKKNKTIFTGDVLFYESIGRTDLPGGDYDVLINSIKNKIFSECDDDFEIYPGHNNSSTIGYEKKNNPFLN